MDLGFHIDLCVVGIEDKPWFTCSEAGVLPTVPLHGRSGVVTVVGCHDLQRLFLRISGLPCYVVLVKSADIVNLLQWDHTQVFHADLLSLIDERKAFQHEIQSSQHFFAGIAAVTFRNIVADTPGLVMVFNDVG